MFYISWVFKDKLSWFVAVSTFIFGLIAFGVFPQEEGSITLLRTILGFIYSLLFAIVFTCLTKTLKEKIIERIRYKGNSGLGKLREFLQQREYKKAFFQSVKVFAEFVVIFIGVLGFGAAQFCTFGSPVCAVSLGTTIVTAIVPNTLLGFLIEYGNWIIASGIFLQFIGLIFMGCFKKIPNIVSEN